jgi:hypothetical protein
MTDEFEYNICAHLQNARCNSNAQYKAALAAERVHYIVGLPAIVLGTLVSTSIFASLDSSPDAAETIVVGAVGLLASALAAANLLQLFRQGTGVSRRGRAIWRCAQAM